MAATCPRGRPSAWCRSRSGRCRREGRRRRRLLGLLAPAFPSAPPWRRQRRPCPSCRRRACDLPVKLSTNWSGTWHQSLLAVSHLTPASPLLDELGEDAQAARGSMVFFLPSPPSLLICWIRLWRSPRNFWASWQSLDCAKAGTAHEDADGRDGGDNIRTDVHHGQNPRSGTRDVSRAVALLQNRGR